MRRCFACLTTLLLAASLMIGVGWACSPNYTPAISVDPIDEDQAPALPAIERAKGEAYRMEGGGCDDCGDLHHATLNFNATDTSSPAGIELDFPDGKPAGVGFGDTEPTIFDTRQDRGPAYFLRIPWNYAKPVKVRARLVDDMGGAGAWSAVFTVRRKEVSCSGGLGWPLILLALAWRPLRRRRRA